MGSLHVYFILCPATDAVWCVKFHMGGLGHRVKILYRIIARSICVRVCGGVTVVYMCLVRLALVLFLALRSSVVYLA